MKVKACKDHETKTDCAGGFEEGLRKWQEVEAAGMTGYVITTEIDGGACLSRSAAGAAAVRGADCRGPSKKTLSGVGFFFFCFGALLVLEAFRGRKLLAPTTTCSLGASRAAVFRYRRGRCASLLLECPPGPLVSWVPCGAGCLGAFRTRSCLGCPAGPAVWVPPQGTD